MKFRKKPIVIEAFQLTEKTRSDNSEWPAWAHEAWNYDRNEPGSLSPFVEGDGTGALRIVTLEGVHRCDFGDWIIRGIKGELYPCKPDIFEMTYESAEYGTLRSMSINHAISEIANRRVHNPTAMMRLLCSVIDDAILTREADEWLAARESVQDRAKAVANKYPKHSGEWGNEGRYAIEASAKRCQCDAERDGKTCTRVLGHSGPHWNGLQEWGEAVASSHQIDIQVLTPIL